MISRLHLLLRCATSGLVRCNRFTEIITRNTVKVTTHQNRQFFGTPSKLHSSTDKAEDASTSPEANEFEVEPEFKSCSTNKLPEALNSPETDEFEIENQSPYVEVDIEEITGGDEKKLHAFKILQLEVDVMAQQGEKVPRHLRTSEWIELLKIETYSERMRYFQFLWLNEAKRMSQKSKKLAKKKTFDDNEAERKQLYATKITTSGPIIYALQFNCLFHRIYDSTMNMFDNLRLTKAAMYGPNIVIDCSYEEYMSRKNIGHCAKQLLLAWASNRTHNNPSNITFCNANTDSDLFLKIKKNVPQVGTAGFPLHLTPKHYLDLYPKKNLVYLTPHCNQDLGTYNSDDIYIIGAFVDQSKTDPVSLAKAKKEGLRMAKFPLDRHLSWSQGTKSLTINQCVDIMNDLNDTRDWEYALRHIPQRKLRQIDPEQDEVRFDAMSNRSTAKEIREQYRRNLVYDLLMKNKLKNPKDSETGEKTEN